MIRIERVVLATNLTILLVTALTVAADLYAPLKAWLAATFLHHWIGKGILALALFAVVSFLPTRPKLEKQLRLTIWLTIACTLVIFAFFTWEFLKG